MFIKMILKTIPRSIRAGVALIVALVLLGSGLKAMQQLLVPGEDSKWTVVKCIGGLLFGLVAMVLFYYFQSIDGETKEFNELDTLNKYQESEREKQKLKDVEITHAYPEDFTKDSSKKV